MKDTLANENFLLAEKLRNEDPEQFYTLVRMHLSFVLDLNTDDCDGNSEKKCKALKWNLPFTKKQKPGTKNVVDSNILPPEFFHQIKPVIEFLRKDENICQEGIFRRSGKVTKQQELKLLLHQGAELNFNNGLYSVHECATVLKNILSELPESILTDAHYPAYCQIAEFFNGKNPTNRERLLRSLQLLILLLPSDNRRFFQEIIELLNLAVHHEEKNRMSAENLATLFTPHLLCPRRLSPEALHTNSQVMSRVVTFMIQKGSELFEIPPTVATDVRAYWNKKKIRNMSPLKQINESICDGTAANTVFTFVDREKTAEENRTNPTETALAQLYAYIQALPESSKKRKLIKQFNKENGYGTPLRTVASKKRIKTLNLGGSIKKHLSGFNKTAKRNINSGNSQGEYEEALSPDSDMCGKKNVDNDEDKESSSNNGKQFLVNGDVSIHKKKCSKSERLITSCDDNSISTPRELSKRKNICKSLEALDCKTTSFNGVDDLDESVESTPPDRSVKFISKRNSVSFQESPPLFKTPRIMNTHDRPINLPVSSVFSNEEHRYDPVSNTKKEVYQNFDLSNEFSDSAEKVEGKGKKSQGVKDECMNNLCKTPKQSGRFPTESLAETGSSNTWKTPIQKFSDVDLMANNCSFSSSNHTNRLPILYGTKTGFLMTTSTPAQGNNCLMNPVVDKNNSMSPITKSARRMPKAMQETMMTPRSRKPVISLSGTDLCSLVSSDSLEGEGSEIFGTEPKSGGNLIKKLEDLNEEVNDSLSSTFRNYLFSRSVLTASPVDLSFSSRTDDFMSVSEKNSSDDDFKSLPEILNEAGLSESLLYCLDGNDPESCSESSKEEKNVGECSCALSECDNDLSPVYETAL